MMDHAVGTADAKLPTCRVLDCMPLHEIDGQLIVGVLI